MFASISFKPIVISRLFCIASFVRERRANTGLVVSVLIKGLTIKCSRVHVDSITPRGKARKHVREVHKAGQRIAAEGRHNI